MPSRGRFTIRALLSKLAAWFSNEVHAPWGSMARHEGVQSPYGLALEDMVEREMKERRQTDGLQEVDRGD